MNQYKITVPMLDGETFVIDLQSNLDSPAVKHTKSVELLFILEPL